MQSLQQEQSAIPGKPLLAVIALLEWFALPAQFYLLINSADFTLAGAFVRFFSFFTVLTNSIVAVCSTVLLLGRPAKAYNFFRRNTTITAITVYIVIVGLVYNIILRPLQQLDGLHLITSEIFHTIVPLLFLVYWWIYVSKHNLSWKSIPAWMIYPLLYMIYTVFHGRYSDFYPYPFIDINKLGFSKAMVNGLFVLLSFIVVSALFIGIGRMSRKITQGTQSSQSIR